MIAGNDSAGSAGRSGSDNVRLIPSNSGRLIEIENVRAGNASEGSAGRSGRLSDGNANESSNEGSAIEILKVSAGSASAGRLGKSGRLNVGNEQPMNSTSIC